MAKVTGFMEFHRQKGKRRPVEERVKDWKEYEIPLNGKDLRCIKTGFVLSVVGAKEPITFYLDDIQYE